MRGKLVKPEANILKWLGYANLLISGYNIHGFLDTNNYWYLGIGIAVGIIGIVVLIQHWLINHPRMPEWAEPYSKENQDIHQLGK